MTKTKRKILSMFLSLCMVVSCMVGFSITASAIYEASGLEKFIPVLDSEGNIASYDVSIKVNDDHKNYPRMARLLFSELSISQIKEKWSDIQTGWNYIEGDSPVRLEGSKINISEIGVDTEDISYNSPVSGGVNTLDFSFDAVPLDANKNYNVYFVLRYGEWGGRYTIYRIIGDSLGTLQQMKINYNRQSESGAYDITVINTHYISGKDLDVSKLGTIPTGYCLNTAKSSSNGKWNGTSDINIYYDIAVASVTDGSTTTNYSDFAAAVTAWNSAANGSTLKLLADVTTASTVTVSGTKILDLNGCGIRMTGNSRVMDVGSGANLTLIDSDTTKIHKYTIADPKTNGAGLATVDDTNGTTAFTGGYITGGNISGDGGGVRVIAGTFTMNGGTIIGNNATGTGGGIYIDDTGNTIGKCVMNSGAIIGNKAGSGFDPGGGAGVAIRNGYANNEAAWNTFVMNDGDICYNYTECRVGGGIRIYENSKCEVKGGTIANNYAKECGAGIGEGHLYLSGAPVIKDNYIGGNEQRNIALYNSSYQIFVTGELNNADPYGVAFSTGVSGKFTSSTNTALNDISKFKSDITSYTVGKYPTGNANAGQLFLGTARTLTYDANEATSGTVPVASETYASGSSVTVLDNTGTLTKTGYTFDGWNTKADGTGTSYAADDTFTISADTTLYAKWTINQYKITFDTDGGTTIVPITQDYNTAVTAPADPTKTGYTFAGWEPAIPETMPAENVTVKATWTINQYTITFNTDGGSAIAPITQGYNTAVTAPADPTKTGYTFNGWDKTIPTTMPAENTTIKAKWTVNQYTITFDTDGGSAIAAITKDYNTAVTAPADPTKTGYTFAGWEPAIPETMPAENVTVKATWTINQYTITFDTDGGTEVAPITQDYNTAVTAPADPTKTGYTFAGWDKAIPTTMPAENITVKATWTINQYTITFVSFGKTVEEYELDYGTNVPVPATPSVEGLRFVCWGPSIPATMPAEDLVITARWSDDATHDSSKPAASGGSSSSSDVSGTGENKNDQSTVKMWAKLNDDHSVTVGWDKISGASKYILYYEKDGKEVQVTETAKTKITMKTAKNGFTYKFRLKYITSGQTLDAPTDYTANLKVYYKPIVKLTQKDGKVTAKWAKVPGAEYYKVYKVVNGKLKYVTKTTKTAVRFTVNSGKTYTFSVSAVVGGKETVLTKSDRKSIKVK